MIEWYYFIAGFICGILLWKRKTVVKIVNAFTEKEKTTKNTKKISKAEKKKLLKQLLEED